MLDRVESGELITITVDGRPVAVLGPVTRRARWIARNEFTEAVLSRQADAGLAADLAVLSNESTADLSFR